MDFNGTFFRFDHKFKLFLFLAVATARNKMATGLESLSASAADGDDPTRRSANARANRKERAPCTAGAAEESSLGLCSGRYWAEAAAASLVAGNQC